MVALPGVVGAKVSVMPEVSRNLLRDSDGQSARQAGLPCLLFLMEVRWVDGPSLPVGSKGGWANSWSGS